MTTSVYYIYAGENGFIQSPVKIPGASIAIEKFRLTADEGMILTNGIDKKTSVVTFKEDVPNWQEIKA